MMVERNTHSYPARPPPPRRNGDIGTNTKTPNLLGAQGLKVFLTQ